GAIAGALSPFAPTGVIANNLLRDRLGLSGGAWPVYLHNLLANTFVAFAGYLAFGGWRLFRRRHDPAGEPAGAGAGPLLPRHRATLVVIGLFIVMIVGFEAHVGMAALAGAALLTLLRLADEAEAVARMPWGVILTVCGVTVLTALLEKTGATDRLTRL